MREGAALVALLRERPGKRSWPEIAAEVVARGSALDVWHELLPATLDLETSPDLLSTASEDIACWTADGTRFLTVLDQDYPARLRAIHQAPPVLFARGKLRSDDPAVSVVGSRAASDRGLKIAESISAALVHAGISVVAGLAAGVDTAAHRTALAAGGRTVAVIGTGINIQYPAANRALHAEITQRGLLLSQFWPDAPPQKHTFLMRNATMSGYGLATVVVEAGETSGARAQARMAVEHGRPVVLTTLVVDRNDWAKALVDRPSVHVASSAEDVVTFVQEVVTSGNALGDQLRELALT